MESYIIWLLLSKDVIVSEPCWKTTFWKMLYDAKISNDVKFQQGGRVVIKLTVKMQDVFWPGIKNSDTPVGVVSRASLIFCRHGSIYISHMPQPSHECKSSAGEMWLIERRLSQNTPSLAPDPRSVWIFLYRIPFFSSRPGLPSIIRLQDRMWSDKRSMQESGRFQSRGWSAFYGLVSVSVLGVWPEKSCARCP